MSQTSAQTQRQPGLIQKVIMLATVGVSVLVTAVLGPSLFLMEKYFQDVENVKHLVPLNMTLPMLVMSVFSFIAGAISDRVGRKWLLVGAAALYAIIGTAPLYLNDLHTILGSRVVLGVFEAFVMVVGIALIGDFFVGSERARLLALQTTVASFSAFVLNNAGGYLGEISWRAPYVTYLFGFVLALAAAVFLWEPDRRGHRDEFTDTSLEPEMQPMMIGLTVLLAVVVGFVFLVTPVHFGYMFRDIGFTDQVWIGRAYGINSLGVISGTLLFGWGVSGRTRIGVQIAAGALMMAAGFFGMWLAKDFTALTTFGFVNGLGAGLLLPAVVTWNMRLLPTKIRGLGTGAWQSGFFLGNFIAANAVVAIADWLGGGRTDAVRLFAIGLIVLAVFALIGWLLEGRNKPASLSDS